MSADVKADNQPYDDINVTPMLDLAYVLLVVFIIMTTASVQGVKVESPRTEATKNLAKPQTRAITITADGSIYLDAYPVTLDQLAVSLARYKAANPALPVVLKGDARTQYATVMAVLEVAKSLDITEVKGLEDELKTKEEETGADKILNTWNKVEHGLSWVFQNSERFNREVTLLAAYKLEYNKLKKQGKLSDQEIAERAATKAIETVEEANGSSMSETGPALFQSDLGKIVGTFKRFALAQIFLASKLFAKAFGPGTGATKEERSIARKQFGYINGMAFTFAGIKGMPFFGGLYLIASAILGDDDEPFDLEGDILSSEASWALRGPMSELIGADIASRTGYTDLVWRDDPKRLAEVGLPTYVAELALGPAMGIVNNFRRGMTDIEQGHTERGIEAMLPAAIRNAMKSIRFGIEGATTKEGVKLTDDPNGYELVMQFLGFTPKELGDRYAANEIMKKAQRNGLERRTALLARLNLAKQEGDLDEILEIRQKIQSFNTRGPGGSIVKPITADTISKSEKQFHVKQRQMAQTGGVYLGKPMSREVRNLRALVPDEDED
jgi:biopolymer transport protein ExbD